MNTDLVYLLDDSKDFNLLVESAFKKLGIATQSFSDTKSFMRAVRSQLPSVALIDIDLGDESGFDILEEVREEVSKTLPLIMISSLDNPQIVAHALEIGANDYIFKPIDRNIMISKLSSYLKSDFSQNQFDLVEMVPDEAIEFDLFFDGKLIEIDELGIWIESQSLIAKDTKISLDNRLLKEILKTDLPVKVRIIKTTIDDNELYELYGEFFDLDQSQTSSLEQWISSQK